MENGTALLRSILDNPQDDFVRNVYADWLEEQGAADHADFIRLQLELSALGPCVAECRNRIDYECRGCALRRRERELFSGRYVRWFPDWSRHVTIAPPNEREAKTDGMFLLVRRGFIESAWCTLADWLQHGPALVACQPVEVVRVTDREPHQLIDGYFSWITGVHSPGLIGECASMLPAQLFDLIEAGALSPHGVCRFYPTRAAANAALSDALLMLARCQRVTRK